MDEGMEGRKEGRKEGWMDGSINGWPHGIDTCTRQAVQHHLIGRDERETQHLRVRVWKRASAPRAVVFDHLKYA